MRAHRVALGLPVLLALACATPSFLQTPAQRMCTRLVDVCDLQPTAEHDPLASCVTDLQDFVDDGSPDDVASLERCVTQASGCGEVQGCLAGAGLKRVFDELGGLFRGIGEMFKREE